MRLNAHFGELPSGAFQHCGDKKIKLQGGGGGFIDNIVDAVVDPVKDAGSWIDDKVNEEIPMGWLGVAALAGGAYLGAEAIAAGNAAETAALAEGATAAEAASAGASAATATEAAVAGTDFLGSAALGGAETGAVGTGSTGFGINAAAPSIGVNAGTGSLLATTPVDSVFGISTTSPAGNFGEFNPNIGSGVSGSSGIGIDAGSAANIEYLGGASSLPTGTAGLTAEQLASAGGALSDAAATSGLGYLGGAEALPTGTAGITTTVPAETSLSTTDALRAANTLNSLLAEKPTQPTGTTKSIVPRGAVDYSGLYNLLATRARTPNLLSLLG